MSVVYDCVFKVYNLFDFFSHCKWTFTSVTNFILIVYSVFARRAPRLQQLQTPPGLDLLLPLTCPGHRDVSCSAPSPSSQFQMLSLLAPWAPIQLTFLFSASLPPMSNLCCHGLCSTWPLLPLQAHPQAFPQSSNEKVTSWSGATYPWGKNGQGHGRPAQSVILWWLSPQSLYRPWQQQGKQTLPGW